MGPEVREAIERVRKDWAVVLLILALVVIGLLLPTGWNPLDWLR